MLYIDADANLFCSSSGGSRWSPAFTNIGHPKITAWAISDAYYLLGATNTYRVYASSDAGANWSEIEYGQNVNTLSLAIQNGYAFAGTDGCGVWRWPLPNSSSVAHAPVLSDKPVFGVRASGHRTNNVLIDFSLPEPDQVAIQITDMQGRTAYSSLKRYPVAGNYTVLWKVQNCVTGVYLARIQTDLQAYRKCFMLIR